MARPPYNDAGVPGQPVRPATYSRSANRLLILSVLAFIVAIGLVWGWSLREQIAQFEWGQTQEHSLIQTVQTNWQSAIHEGDDNTQARIETENSLKKLLRAVPTHSTQTTTSFPTTSSKATAPTSTP